MALATFAVGTDGYVIAGLLPSIAADLHVTVPVAGQLVTAFALTFAVSAPVLGAATSALDRRTALLLALGVFIVGNAATAVGTTYEVVLAARVVTAAGAGIITSAASSTAAAITPPERRGRALAFVLGGLTLATALGLPLGTLIGDGDWHLTLWAVAALGLVAALGIAVGLPRITLPAATLRERFRPLKETWVLGVLTVSVLFFLGTYVLYTYVVPALDRATGGSGSLVTLILLAWGLGTLGGNLLAGRLVDRHAPGRILAWCLGATVPLLAVTPLATCHLATAVVWAVAWGVCVGMPVVPQQHRLIAHAPAAAPVLLGLNSSSVYVGVALGGALGGLTQDRFGLRPEQLGLFAAAVVAVAFVLTFATLRPSRP
ncbi:MFS transporter, partial [Streptomyces sp. UNOC14_S4]|uniref:MFS transporter n=1 Tax=Streptomyces sp. UNOC14_S4 TaxID=2872340 RepID=UPI001E2E9E34